MNTLADYKPGDVLLFTQRSMRAGKVHEEKRTGIVSIVDYNGCGMVTINGYHVDERYLTTGSGAFDPATVGTKPFGFYCAVEKIGERSASFGRTWQPRPGDRAYDLMC